MWNVQKSVTQRVRYLSLATMLVRMNKLEDPRFAELQQRLQGPALQLAKDKGCKRIDEFKRLCPGLATLMQETKCKQNKEMNRLCEILAAVWQLLPSVFEYNTVVYDAAGNLGPEAMTQNDFERLGIMDQHVVPGEKGRSVWKRVSNKVSGAETNPPLFGFPYLELENMYEDEDRSLSTQPRRRALQHCTSIADSTSAEVEHAAGTRTAARARRPSFARLHQALPTAACAGVQHLPRTRPQRGTHAQPRPAKLRKVAPSITDCTLGFNALPRTAAARHAG